MTSERDGKSGRGQPDLLATLPAERPPASQPASGIDPAQFEELLTEIRDLREEVAGLRTAAAAERPAPSAGRAPVTPEVLEAWGDKFVTRVADAARTAEAPGDDAAAVQIGRMEDAAAKAAAAAARIDGGLESTADRVVAEIGSAAARIETGLRITRDHVTQRSSLTNSILEDIRTQTAGPRFGLGMVLAGLIVFVLGMVLESRVPILYSLLWAR